MEYAKRFSQGHWCFLRPSSEKKWNGTLPCTPEGKWDSTATQMVERFTDTGHPVLKSVGAVSRGILKKKDGRDTIRFNADASNTELTFRNIHSVNQLSIYGAVPKWCEQFGLTEEKKRTRKTERIRDQRCIDKCEITRSKTFGIPSKTSIWKQFAGKNQDFESLTQAIHQGLRTCIVPALGISWNELQTST